MARSRDERPNAKTAGVPRRDNLWIKGMNKRLLCYVCKARLLIAVCCLNEAGMCLSS
jgi:hypothetical protein